MNASPRTISVVCGAFLAFLLGAPAAAESDGSSERQSSEQASTEQPKSEQHRSEQAIRVGFEPTWYLMAGLTGGGSFQESGPGGYLGAEISVVRSHNDFWLGLYADQTIDFRTLDPVTSVGPEFGYGVVGIDGGAALRWHDSGPIPGVLGRLSVSAGVFGLYGRYLYWPTIDNHGMQVGMSLKLPLISPWGPGTKLE